jgi:hypothetical protein
MLALVVVVDAFHTSSRQPTLRRSTPLNGILEWRNEFSLSQKISINNNTEVHGDDFTLPLLLLPFAPSQILLPGQTTTMKFKHGKYMDIIDESMTSYHSVLGLSLVGEDGPLPYAVICEVLGDELEVNMGYRGFSSMEVGIRAVGRAKRYSYATNESSREGQQQVKIIKGNDYFRGRTTISDDIHLGQFIEWHDDIITNDEFEVASEYSATIEELFSRIPNDDNACQRLMQFTEVYQAMLEHLTASPPNSNTMGYSESEQQNHMHFTAFSWASVAACDDPSASIITQALTTTNTVERLRLGLTMMMDSQIPLDKVGGEIREDSFQ